jgi:hypothetical protein
VKYRLSTDGAIAFLLETFWFTVDVDADFWEQSTYLLDIN